MADYKKCTSCERSFENTLDNFFKKLKGLTSRCKTCSSIANKTNYHKHKDAYLLQKQEYWVRNKDIIGEYRLLHKKRDRQQATKNQRQRRLDSPVENIRKSIGSSIRQVLNRGKGSNLVCKLSKIVGCTTNELLVHLINTFVENYGVAYSPKFLKALHVDHIIPVANVRDKQEMIVLNHHANLQLLYKGDNRAKGVSKQWELDRKSSGFYASFNIDLKNVPCKQGY